jgi:ketosteroid isomerase-like protein
MDLQSNDEFRARAETVARGWETQNPDAALACFDPEAVYIEPPDVQLFVGFDQLRPYFAAVPPGTTMTIHRTWFDPVTQSGSIEFSFAGAGRDMATHGIAALTLRNGRIVEWCELQREGPRAWADFKRTDGKDWRWTADNYPP